MHPTRTGATLALCCAAAVFGLGAPAVSRAAAPNVAKAAKSCSWALAAKLQSKLSGESYVAQPLNPYDSFLSIFPQNELKLVARNPAEHRVIATGVCYYDDVGTVKSITVHRGSQMRQDPGFP